MELVYFLLRLRLNEKEYMKDLHVLLLDCVWAASQGYIQYESRHIIVVASVHIVTRTYRGVLLAVP